mmetsp:Transcript_1318/g.3138  ORF Transcript_1318/g.3138 Transcript_1318/m.3138 type:complete len:555 (+) Transcript_1318:2235-3899(+)
MRRPHRRSRTRRRARRERDGGGVVRGEGGDARQRVLPMPEFEISDLGVGGGALEGVEDKLLEGGEEGEEEGAVVAAVAEVDVALVGGVRLEVRETFHHQLQLAHVRLQPEALGLLVDHAEVQGHIPVSRGPVGVVGRVEPVLDAQDVDVVLDRDLPQALGEVADLFEDDALPCDVDEPRGLRIHPSDLLDGAVQALELAPVDALRELEVVLGLRPLDVLLRPRLDDLVVVHLQVDHPRTLPSGHALHLALPHGVGHEREPAVALVGPRLHLGDDDEVHVGRLRVELVERRDRRALVDAPRDRLDAEHALRHEEQLGEALQRRLGQLLPVVLPRLVLPVVPQHLDQHLQPPNALHLGRLARKLRPELRVLLLVGQDQPARAPQLVLPQDQHDEPDEGAGRGVDWGVHEQVLAVLVHADVDGEGQPKLHDPRGHHRPHELLVEEEDAERHDEVGGEERPPNRRVVPLVLVRNGRHQHGDAPAQRHDLHDVVGIPLLRQHPAQPHAEQPRRHDHVPQHPRGRPRPHVQQVEVVLPPAPRGRGVRPVELPPFPDGREP